MRRYIIITLIVLIIAAAGVLVYFMFFKASSETIIPLRPKSSSSNNIAQENQQGGGLKKISSFETVAPGLNPEGTKVRFFERSTGNLYEANFDGTDSQKTSESLLATGLAKLIWSPRYTLFAALFEESRQNFIYEFRSGRSLFFAKAIKNASFSPNQQQIVFEENNGTTSSVVVSNPNGSARKTLLAGALPMLNFVWLKSGLISIWPASSGLNPSFLISLNQNGVVGKLLDNLYGLSALWSPNTENFVFSHTDGSGKNVVLETKNKKGERINLNINTLAEKCAWASDNRTVYCAVPEQWPQTATLPDDYYKGVVGGKDRLFKIDTQTTISNLVFEDKNIDIDASNIFLSPQEDYLLFLNRNDGFLYSMKL